MWFWGRGVRDAENGKRDKERAVSGGFFGPLESFFDWPSMQNAISCDSETIGRRELWSRVYAYTGAFLESLGAVLGGAGKVVSIEN